jgi:hypothetical protein
MNGRTALLPGLLVLVSGCSKPQPPPGSINLLVASGRASAEMRPGPSVTSDSAGAWVAVGSDTLFLQHVVLVLRDLEIAPADAGDCEGSAEEDEPPCPQLAVGPMLLTVPLGTAADTSLSARLVPGTYSLLQFQIQTPAPGRDDRFVTAHPELGEASVHVVGIFSKMGNRRAVSYTLPFNEREQLEVNPPLAVAGGGSSRLTLRVDVARWFLNAQGTALIDPASAVAGQPNERQVWDNIRMSLSAETTAAP